MSKIKKPSVVFNLEKDTEKTLWEIVKSQKLSFSEFAKEAITEKVMRMGYDLPVLNGESDTHAPSHFGFENDVRMQLDRIEEKLKDLKLSPSSQFDKIVEAVSERDFSNLDSFG